MGFRTGAYAKIWEVTPMSDTSTKVRLSVSRKNKQTNEYEQDFSGFVLAIGTAAAKKAACLKEGERIKLGDVDVTTKYDKEKKVTYTNFKMFSFEVEGDESSSQTTDPQPMRKALKDNNGFCPCAIEKNEDTKCMCKEFREMASGTCHCGLYTKTE